MARPRPVRPYLRVVEASTCENDWKSLLWASGGMPDAGILDGKLQLVGFVIHWVGVQTEDDFAFSSKLQRIADQVDQDLAQARDIPLHLNRATPSAIS